MFTDDTNKQTNKPSNFNFHFLDVYTVTLFPHRNFLLRIANSSPCAVHNKQDEVLNCCSIKYRSLRACIAQLPHVLCIFVSIIYLVPCPFFITSLPQSDQLPAMLDLANNLTQIGILRTTIMNALTSCTHYCNRRIGVNGGN